MNFNHDSAVMENAGLMVKDAMPYQGFMPYQYTDPRNELLGAREGAWLGCYLNMAMFCRMEVFGPDAAEFLNSVCVNRNFNKMKVGGSRHALICNDKGQIVATGVITRTEDRFLTFCVGQILGCYAAKTDLDVTVEVKEEFMYQIDGPRSLEIMEEAAQCDLHDMKFGANRYIEIAGKNVFIYRLGMSGALGYEMHGAPEDADVVYRAIMEAGKDKGLRQLGIRNYCSNHSSGGYPNQYIHFDLPWNAESLGKEMAAALGFPGFPLSGSAKDDNQNYYVTPYMVGWGGLVSFDHDFPGKEALLRERDEDTYRKVVTLEWNLEDVKNLYFDEIFGRVDEDEDILGFREMLADFRRAHADRVVDGDKTIGIAAGRTIDYFYEKFISLAYLDRDYLEEGTQVEILWGTPGSDQRRIRATVARFPYFDEEYRNETYDVVANVPRKFEDDGLLFNSYLVECF
ncbi:MAG: aminomethyltransferase family protein [Eggerthellaceae bacterium]|nr:aminomethyltransferase family protein [Eggerthellaceae bacterium]